MSDATTKVALELPPEALEAIAERAAEIVLARVSDSSPRSPYMTAREAADYLRWPVKRVYNLTAARAIPCMKHEGRILLNRKELDEWLTSYHEGPRRDAGRESEIRRGYARR